MYWSSCYQNVVQNKETSLENVSARQGDKTSAANKRVSFQNHIHISVQTIMLACLFVYDFFFAMILLSRPKKQQKVPMQAVRVLKVVR